jgi:hypothetical protein
LFLKILFEKIVLSEENSGAHVTKWSHCAPFFVAIFTAMQTENSIEIPLAEEDKVQWNLQRKKFFKGAFWRFVAIGLMLLFVHWGLRHWLHLDAQQIQENGTFFNYIFLAVTIAFIGVVIFLYNRDFKLAGTKLVTTGVLKRKDYLSHKSDLDRYEVDRDKKKLKLWLKSRAGGIGGGTEYCEFNYDKEDFEGYLKQGEYLLFFIDNQEFKVDVKHFAEFNEGEKITIEQFSDSKRLIRISSNDVPEKVISTTTMKFN